MIRAYRLVKKKWTDAAFDGQGAKRYGGRWNSKGRACVYLTKSIALGLLEVSAHANDYSILQHYAVFELRFDPTDVMRLSAQSLAEDWQVSPAPLSTADIGDQWLDQAESVLLAVPSVIVPQEVNYLLNPAHPRHGKIIDTVEEIRFGADSGLLR